MGFKEAVNSVLKQNYANFQGRASRSEYWFFALFVFIVAAILTALLFATVDFNTQQISGLGYVIIAILAVFYLGILIPRSLSRCAACMTATCRAGGIWASSSSAPSPSSASSPPSQCW